MNEPTTEENSALRIHRQSLDGRIRRAVEGGRPIPTWSGESSLERRISFAILQQTNDRTSRSKVIPYIPSHEDLPIRLLDQGSKTLFPFGEFELTCVPLFLRQQSGRLLQVANSFFELANCVPVLLQLPSHAEKSQHPTGKSLSH